jgi:hypothetical protein
MRFRFTVRDLLWLTAVVALAIGWWLQWKHSAAKLHAVQEKLAFAEQMERLEMAVQHKVQEMQASEAARHC